MPDPSDMPPQPDMYGRGPLEIHEIVEGWRQEFAHDDTPPLRWVTLAEAEEAAGVSRSTLRAWFRSGEVPSRLEAGPHGPQRLVPVEAVLDKARRSPARGRARPRANETETGDALVTLVGTLIARAEERAAAAETALHAALERAAAAEAEVRVLRDALHGRT